jgi:hypothetical protein
MNTGLQLVMYKSWFGYVKGKGFLLQAWTDSWGSRRLRLLDLLDFQHYEGGKVVTLTHQPPSPPGVFLVLIFRGWVDPKAHGSVGSFGKKSPVTPLGIDPETFRLVAQCLNHYAIPGPIWLCGRHKFSTKGARYIAKMLFNTIPSNFMSLCWHIWKVSLKILAKLLFIHGKT